MSENRSINEHSLQCQGQDVLRCIVVGSRLACDVVDYPKLGKRHFRNAGLPWSLVDQDRITHPKAEKKWPVRKGVVLKAVQAIVSANRKASVTAQFCDAKLGG